MNVLGLATIVRIASEEIVTDAQGHVTTHSAWLPETAEIIYGGLSSLLIFWALFKFGGPAIKKGMAEPLDKSAKELPW